MARSLHLSLLAASLLASTALVTPAQAAGLASCGNIHVEAEATCKVEVEGGCVAKCEPIAFEAACAAKLDVECRTECSDLPSVDCTGSCQGSCEGECAVEPATFECEGSCKVECEGTCSGKCSAAANRGECEAQCNATCSGECSVSCEGTPATAECSGKCEASCEGSCKADLNMDCQTRCQGDAFAQCKLDMKGGCEVACTKPEGAAFCDGQYIDHGNNAAECFAALRRVVTLEASGSASCSGNSCEAEGRASARCATAPLGRSLGSSGLLAAALGTIGLSAARRRTARR